MTQAVARPVKGREKRCLVLNVDGRPLSTWPPSLISAKQAIKKLLRDRITVVESWPDQYHSDKRVVAIPKVAMLRHFAPVHGAPKFCRASVFLRDRYCCQYCGEKFDWSELTFDHLIPRADGGKTEWDNVLTACVACNKEKAARRANHSGRARGHLKTPGAPMRPLKQPRQPLTSELMRAGLELLPKEILQDFGSFLYWNVPLGKE